MVSRRALLRALGAATAVCAAGCNAPDDDTSTTATATLTATLRPTTDAGIPAPTGTPTATITPTGERTADAARARLTPSDGSFEEFGRAVALSEAAAVVLSDGTGAHVFEPGDSWRPTTVLTPDGEPDFGGYHASATLVGEEAVLGGPGIGTDGGEVYLFGRTGGEWRQRHRFVPVGERPEFGRSVAFDGDRVVVGDNNDPTPMRS